MHMRLTGLAVVGATVMLIFATAVSGQNLAADYLQRYHQLKDSDVPGRMALAAWAENRGLDAQAMQLYAEVLDRSPDHDAAYRSWVALADTHALPPEPERERELTRQFADMELIATDHFLVLHDTDDVWARQRAALLEKTHNLFYSTFRRVMFKPQPLRQRLVCILFADHADYLAYARAVDQADAAWAAGYYSTRSNRIVFYDDRVGPRLEQLKRQVDLWDERAEHTRTQLQDAIKRRNQALVMQLRRDYRADKRRLDWFRKRYTTAAELGNAAKTTHEVVHQLAYNSRLQRADRLYPLWFSEGLATSFEAEDPLEPYGPLAINTIRLAGLQAAVNGDGLIPLAELVAIGEATPDNTAQLALAYDQSWALFTYLFRHERQSMQRYLSMIAAKAPGVRSAEQLRDEFVHAFGPLHVLEPRFEAYVRQLR